MTTTTKTVKVETLAAGTRFMIPGKFPQTGTFVEADSMYATVCFDGRSGREHVAPSMDVVAVADGDPVFCAIVEGAKMIESAKYAIELDGYSHRERIVAKSTEAVVEGSKRSAAAKKAWETMRAKQAAAAAK